MCSISTTMTFLVIVESFLFCTCLTRFHSYGSKGKGVPAMRNENHFQSALIKEIKGKLEDCVILKNDGSNVPQGFPDLLILYKNQWGALECKREEKADKQPNQEYYVDKLDDMSFSRFISPENKEEVLNELYSTFGLSRSTRVSRRKQVSLD